MLRTESGFLYNQEKKAKGWHKSSVEWDFIDSKFGTDRYLFS